MWQKLTLAYVFLKRATPNKLSLYDKPLLTTVSVSLKLLSAGLEKIEQAKAQGNGVILLGAHYSMLDLAGALIANHIEVSVTYKRQKHPVLNYVMERGRSRHYKNCFVSKETRAIVKALRGGDV